MICYKLRELLIVLTIAPPLLAWYGCPTVFRWLEPKPIFPPGTTFQTQPNGTVEVKLPPAKVP